MAENFEVPPKKIQAEEPPDRGRDESPRRKDCGHLHAVRGGLFSRGLLEALRRNGQNTRQLREVERGLRNTIRPKGAMGKFFFDRFWSSALRLILASRLEAQLLTQEKHQSVIPEVCREFLPGLTNPEDDNHRRGRTATSEADGDLLHQLSLIGRYSRGASGELYRSLSVLLLLRDEDDDAALKNWAGALAGIKPRGGG